jgi:hypothetical protein
MGTVRFAILCGVFAVISGAGLPGFAWGQRKSAAAAPTSSVPSGSQPVVISVTDENGVPVASARVQLQPPPPAIALHCETNFAGRCLFPNLASGTYELRCEKTGFYVVSLPNINMGTVPNIEVTLAHHQELHETVEVIESAPAIDPAQIAAKEELTGSEIIDIPYPGPHDFHNALNFIPGVTPDAFGGTHVAGAESYQTLTLLDGFNVTQPATGQLAVRTNVDSFRSIAVQASREPAEYGKGSGGVLSLNTGIGDDHYRFISTDFFPSLQNTKRIGIGEWTPIITVSGPVRKGKMWFVDSLDGEYNNNIVLQLPSGSDSDHVWRVDNLAKLQTNLSTRNILTVSFLSNYFHDPYTGLSPLQPRPTTFIDARSAYIGSVKDQYTFSSGALLETGFGVDQYSAAQTPEGNAPYVLSSGQTQGNYYLNQRTQARRWQGLANLYFPPRQWHGRHDIKVGSDVDRLDYEARFTRQPISFLRASQSPPALPNTCITAAPSPCSRYSTFSGGDSSATYNLETSAYVEDRWLITNRLLIEPGVRFDWDEIVRAPLFSPRVAGTYILDDEANTKFSAGIGIVYDTTNLGLVHQPLEGQRIDYFFDVNGNPTDVNGNPAPQPVPVPTVFSANRSTLREPRYLNWSVGLEKKLPASIFLKGEFIEKRGVRGFAYNTMDGTVDGNFILRNTRDDRYDALQVSLRRNFRQRYAIFGAYTRSRAHTNQAFDFSLDIPLLSPQLPGPYPWDVPNRFVGWGVLPFFRLPIVHSSDIVYSVEARNGLPFNVATDQLEIPPTAPPGTFRLPAYFSLNLAFEKRVHLFGYYWALRGGFNNITGHSNANVANGIIDQQHPAPTFFNSQGRGFVFRIRWLGRK